MKHYKCEGCGRVLQIQNSKLPGFTNKKDSTFCVKCYRSLHYGDKENNLTKFNIETYFQQLKKEDNEVIMVIDVLNPYQTLVSDINKYVAFENLTIVVNKVDALPKSIAAETIIEYVAVIAETKGIKFKNISLVSSIKLDNVDALYNYIMTLKDRVSIIGYSNVGKSSFIKALFKSRMISINNLVSYMIGTTLEPIELDLEGKKIIDYPGFYLETNIQNILSKDELKFVIPRKEIKVTTRQLLDNQIVRIGKYAEFIVSEAKDKSSYQFTFSNDIEETRHKWNQVKPKKGMVKHEIKPLNGIERQDIIISGLGIVTFKNLEQKLYINAPKGVGVDVVESLYSDFEKH